MTKPTEREAFEATMRQGKGFNEHLLARDGRNSDYYGSHIMQAAWEGWNARAHLSQPAQAVDVGAILEVLDEMRGYDWRLKYLSDKLTRAIGNAQAEGLPIETHNRINYVGHPSTNYPPLPTPPKAEE